LQTRKNRRIGLGVMGWADMLIKLRLPYDAPEALALGEKLMEFVRTEARNHSSELAKARGRLPNWENSIYARDGVAMRNATVTTVAPTGTISIIAGCSSGIEPYYSLAYERNVMDGTRLTEVNPLFEKAARDGGFHSDELMAKVASLRSIGELEEIPDAVQAIFLTAADVSPHNHILMQAAFQKHCDSSVSKTINLPENAPQEQVREAFEAAYKLGCKGVTIYRDRSRPDQVLAPISEQAELPVESLDSARARIVAKRPQVLQGITEKIRTGYGNLYVTVNVRDGRPFEVFAHIGKSGYTTMADTEAICRLISLTLRSGVAVDQVIRQLRGIGGSSPVFSNGARVSSIPDAIAQVLHRHFGTPTGERAAAEEQRDSSPQPPDICPSCASAMNFDSGCYYCRSCGYSTC
jgi:ribonucleoside-diphosphate reductase alpha chain